MKMLVRPQISMPKLATLSCIMGIGRGPVLDSKILKQEKREELFENLKADELIGWDVGVIDPREFSTKMLKKNMINLNETSHESAMGLITRVLNMGVLLTEVPGNVSSVYILKRRPGCNITSGFGFPTFVCFSWGTWSLYQKKLVEVSWKSDIDEDSGFRKQQL